MEKSSQHKLRMEATWSHLERQYILGICKFLIVNTGLKLEATLRYLISGTKYTGMQLSLRIQSLFGCAREVWIMVYAIFM